MKHHKTVFIPAFIISFFLFMIFFSKEGSINEKIETIKSAIVNIEGRTMLKKNL